MLKTRDKHAKMKNKLSFLYQNGRMVHFGMYLRNQIFRDDSLKKIIEKSIT